MELYRCAEAIESCGALDSVADPAGAAVQRALPAGGAKDLLSGTWLGHALHPLLTDFPLGFWMSASLLDLVSGRESQKAARRVVGFGLLAAVPVAVTGASDWADTTTRPRRVGVVHAALNGTAWALYASSYLARWRGRRGKATALGVAGGIVATVGGYFGGHLSLARGIGVNTNAFEPAPEDWTALETDGGRRGRAAEADVAVFRAHGRTSVLSRRCTHRGGPLDEGRIEGACVVCPWHGSMFQLEDGSVVRGPATEPQILYSVREEGARVLVRRAAG
jgi:nitrite reductase/ring-hydroxylating ferredoxin subunit/uncharacterized membrane protein